MKTFSLIRILLELSGTKSGLQLRAETTVSRNKTNRHLQPPTLHPLQLAKYD